MMQRRFSLLLTLLFSLCACRRRVPDQAPSLATSVAPSASASCGLLGTPFPPWSASSALAPLSYTLGFCESSASVRQTPDPHWPELTPVEADDTFLFELGTGSAMEGLNVTTVAATGRARHWFKHVTADTMASHRIVEFTVTPEEIQRLVALLNQHAWTTLAGSYEADVFDGAQWVLHLRTHGRDKYVVCSNAFPPAVIAVGQFLSGEIVGRRPGLMAQSRISHLLTGTIDRSLWAGLHRYKYRNGPKQDDVDNGYNHAAVRGLLLAPPSISVQVPARVQLRDRTNQRLIATTVANWHDARAWFELPYDESLVDWHHEYVVEGKTAARPWSVPVLTHGAPIDLEISLSEGEHEPPSRSFFCFNWIYGAGESSTDCFRTEVACETRRTEMSKGARPSAPCREYP